MDLINAAQRNDMEALRSLICSGVDLNYKDSVGRTALYWGSFNGSVECVRIVLEAKADVHGRDGMGAIPLHWACFNGHIECVKVSGRKMSRTRFKSWCFFQLLIAYKANINWKSHYGDSPLHKAAAEGQLECIEVCCGSFVDLF